MYRNNGAVITAIVLGCISFLLFLFLLFPLIAFAVPPTIAVFLPELLGIESLLVFGIGIGTILPIGIEYLIFAVANMCVTAYALRDSFGVPRVLCKINQVVGVILFAITVFAMIWSLAMIVVLYYPYYIHK